MIRYVQKAFLAIGRRVLGEVWYARRLGVRVGEGCSLFRLVYGAEPWLIEIGDRVQVTDGVRLLTHGGGWLMRRQRPKFDSFGPICIGSDVYIGNGVIVLPGVAIGNNVLIAAGTVVAKSVPNGVVVAGNPARIICTVADFEAKSIAYDLGTAGMPAKKKRSVVLAHPDKWIRKPELQ